MLQIVRQYDLKGSFELIKLGTGPRCEPRDDLLLIQAMEKSSTRDAIATVWAKRIGDDIYELQGYAPIAPGFNSHDIVKAVILPGQEMPTISELVRRSGCRTFHIKFSASTTADQREEI